MGSGGTSNWYNYVSPSSMSGVGTGDRKNRFLIGSVLVVFLLLVTSHHHSRQQQQQTLKDITAKPAKHDDFDTKNTTPNDVTTKNATPSSNAGGGGGLNAPSDASNTRAASGGNDNKAPVPAFPDDNNNNIDAPPPPPLQPEYNPSLTYLVAYPMSGTTYTTVLLQTFTDRETATNHPDYFWLENNINNKNRKNELNLVWPEAEEQSPFWRYIDTGGSSNSLPKPTKRVVTLTHCHGYCTRSCPFYQYLLTDSSFDQSCRTVKHPFTSTPTYGVTNRRQQDSRKRMIHLIRGPLSNIVSRYHASVWEENKTKGANRSYDYRNDTEKDKKNFQEWCKVQNQEDVDWSKDEKEREHSLIGSQYVSEEIKDALLDVPCYREFFKYVQWHSHATRIKYSSGSMTPPDPSFTHSFDSEGTSLTVWYEDLESEVEILATGVRMAKFMDLELVDFDPGRIPSFPKVTKYDDWYTPEEKKAVENLVRVMLVHDEDTWNALKRYFKKKDS